MRIEEEIELLKRRIELLENIVLRNQQTEQKEVSKEGRDKTRYMFENKIYPKNRFVLAVVQRYILENNPTLEEIRHVFDKSLQGSLNVIETVNAAKNIKDSGKRYFMNSPFTLKDGNEVVVCTQWGIFNITKFEKVATNLGYHFDKV